MAVATKINSPVNIDDRKALGVGPGDTVRVWQKIEEKGKTRLQAFEGIVLARKHGNEAGATFTVRKVSGGIGVEKIFPLFSPAIDKIEIIRRANVRRSKLYYIREKVAREIRRQMRNMRIVDISTMSDSDRSKDSSAEESTSDGASKAEIVSEETSPAEESTEETPLETKDEGNTSDEVEKKEE